MPATRLSWAEPDEDDVARREAIVAKLDGGGIEIDEGLLRVTMGDPAVFSAEVPLSSIQSVEGRPDLTGPTMGVHGFRGRWLVNRSSKGIVRLTIRPPSTARLALAAMPGSKPSGIGGFVLRWITRDRSVRLRELTLSVEDPEAFVKALSTGSSPGANQR